MCVLRADAVFPGANGKIVHTALGEGTLTVGTVNPDGSSPQNLTAGMNASYAPAYSADGARIAFIRDNGVWVMNADGAAQTELVNEAAWLSIVHGLNPRAMSSKVKGFVPVQSWFQELTKVTVEK